MKAIVLFLKRSMILYLIALLLLGVIIDHNRIKLKTINYLAVPINYMVELSEGEAPLDLWKLRDHMRFYDKVAVYLPNSVMAYGLLGFCHYKLGNEKKAISLLKKAIENNPNYFWFHYNLGLIYLKRQKTEKALLAFQKGYMVNPEGSKYLLLASRLHQRKRDESLSEKEFLKAEDKILQQIDDKLGKGYERTYLLIMQSFNKQKKYESLLHSALVGKKEQLVPDKVCFYYAGVGSYFIGNYQDALMFFQRYLRVAADDPEIFHYIAKCLKAMNQVKLAKQYEHKASIYNSLEVKIEKDFFIDPEDLNLVIY